MLCKCVSVASVAVLALALAFKPIIRPYVLPVIFELSRDPFDASVGTVPVLSQSELVSFYSGKRVLVIGGSRGVGRGTSLALAGAGAHVTVVGRSEKSGFRIVEEMQSAALSTSEQTLDYVQGDLGSVASSHALVASLAAHVAAAGKYDYLVNTAAVFPDWGSLQQEDGLDRGFAIAVIGRYIIYRNVDKFMALDDNPLANAHVRILNVLASGNQVTGFDRSIASGERNVTHLLEDMNTFGVGNELMQIGLEQRGVEFHFGTTRVSTHPGELVTDLHRNQGWFLDLLEPLMVALIGLSEEECGVRQASILAWPQLHSASLNYVDQGMHGRLVGPKLQAAVDSHLDWLFELMDKKVQCDRSVFGSTD